MAAEAKLAAPYPMRPSDLAPCHVPSPDLSISRSVVSIMPLLPLTLAMLACGNPVIADGAGSLAVNADSVAAFRTAGGTRGCVAIALRDTTLVEGDTSRIFVVRTPTVLRGPAGRQTPSLVMRSSAVASVQGTLLRARAAGSSHLVVTDAGCSDSVPVLVRGQTTVDAPAPVRPGFYVSPAGKPLHAANGSITEPWDLATALANPARVMPGDTIWLMAGTYTGNFQSTLTGSAGNPIVLRALPGQRATIEGSMMIRGSNAWYWGFEMTSNPTARESATPGSSPIGIPGFGNGIEIEGQNVKLIHLKIHDVAGGLFAGNLAVGLEVYGCVIYNNGWIGPDRPHGHNLYLQNLEGAAKEIHNNVLFNSFGFNLHIYGSPAASLAGFNVSGNTMLFSGEPPRTTPLSNVVLYGGGVGRLRDIAFRHNSFFSRENEGIAFRSGTPNGPPGQQLTYENNVSHGRVEFMEWNGYTIRNNTFANNFGTGPESWVLQYRAAPAVAFSVNQLNSNRYLAPFIGPIHPLYLTGVPTPFIGAIDGWRARTGFDQSSTHVNGSGTAIPAIIRPSRFESGTTLITYWDLSKRGNFSIPLAGIVQVGDTFVVRSALDYYGTPLATGTYSGQTVQVSTMQRPVSPRGLSSSSPGANGIIAVYIVESSR